MGGCVRQTCLPQTYRLKKRVFSVPLVVNIVVILVFHNFFSLDGSVGFLVRGLQDVIIINKQPGRLARSRS